MNAFKKTLVGYLMGMLGSTFMLNQPLPRFGVLVLATLLEAFTEAGLVLVLGQHLVLPAATDLLWLSLGKRIAGVLGYWNGVEAGGLSRCPGTTEAARISRLLRGAAAPAADHLPLRPDGGPVPLLPLQLWYLQVVNGENYRGWPDNNRLRQVGAEPAAGTSSTGTAAHRPNRISFNVLLDREKVTDREKIVRTLSRVLTFRRRRSVSGSPVTGTAPSSSRSS